MEFTPQKQGKRQIINITSLIDVMFLLLIFFMVTSTFKNQPAINLVLPRAATAEETPVTPAVIFLTADGTFYLNDKMMPVDDMALALERLQAASGDDRIVVQADMGASHGDVVRLIDLVKSSGFTRVSISARKPQGN